jgi:hypothetical protein
MIPLNTGGIRAIAAIGAHCDDVVIGAGATLLKIARHYPDIVQPGSPGQIADALTALASDKSPAGWAGYRSTRYRLRARALLPVAGPAVDRSGARVGGAATRH